MISDVKECLKHKYELIEAIKLLKSIFGDNYGCEYQKIIGNLEGRCQGIDYIITMMQL